MKDRIELHTFAGTNCYTSVLYVCVNACMQSRIISESVELLNYLWIILHQKIRWLLGLLQLSPLNKTMSTMHSLLVLLLLSMVRGNNVYHIISTPSIQCPAGECLSLSMVADNTSYYLDANVTLIFHHGNRNLESDLYFSNMDHLIVTELISATILCSNNASLMFSNIHQIRITGLEFIGCRGTVEFVEHFTLENAGFHDVNSGSALQIIQTYADIIGTVFTYNTMGTYKSEISFYDPSGARVGGALIVTESNLIITNSTFDSNSAEIGGAIFLELDSNVTINGSLFINNDAAGCINDYCSGGALLIDSGCSVRAHNLTFMNNTSETSGGAVFLFKGVYFDMSRAFEYNKAYDSGGAIFAYRNSTIMIAKNYFNENQAVESVGVIYTQYNSTITVTNSSFNNNKGGTFGGVLSINANSSTTIDNSIFSNNEASDKGGVLFELTNCSITVINSYFYNNTAKIDGVDQESFVEVVNLV